MDRAPEGQRVDRQRVGLFGGTFDPPHNGHVSVVRDVADALDLDEILWMPAGEPPHKPHTSVTPGRVRFTMVEAAIAEESRFRASDLEIRRKGPSYTVDTLRALGAGSGHRMWYLIMGMDQYQDFDAWREPSEIRALSTLVVMDRGGESVHGLANPGEIVTVPIHRVDISSSAVRRRVRDGLDVSHLIPPGVADIIRSKHLYEM